MTPKQFKTYLWLIELLDENPGITFKKISDEWAKKRELSKGAPMFVTTTQTMDIE